MPQNHGFRNNSRKNQKPKDHANAAARNDNPITKAFYGYSLELDDKHDRNERIVKLSRDITIESKRIIFLLHSIDGRKNNRATVLEEAQQRLNKLIEINFKAIAKELIRQDPYQYRYAYSPGLQEFIEAYSFMEYFKSGEDDKNDIGLSDWKMLQQKMRYEETQIEKKTDEKDEDTKAEDIVEETPVQATPVEKQKFEFFIDPTEYILGISDLTGELMRRCINSLGSGETDVCRETCKVLQQFYTGYVSLNVYRCREMSRKIFTMRQSVLKAENVCYNVKVRGSEAAKWGSVFENKIMDDTDEGYF